MEHNLLHLSALFHYEESGFCAIARFIWLTLLMGQEVAQLVHLLKDLLLMVSQMTMSVSIRLDFKLLHLLPRYMRSLLFILLRML